MGAGDGQWAKMLGEMLKQCRIVADLTQEELAERTGLSAYTISNLERGAGHVPRLATVRLLANALRLHGEERAAFERAARKLGGARDTSQPETKALDGLRMRLPVPPTPLIGRDDEVLAAAQALCRPGVRLLTLIGAPGVGKTRLALAVAEAIAGDFADGVVFVPLAPVHDPNHVADTIAAAVGVQEEPRRPVLEALHAALRFTQHLLVLDNLEHLADATPLVAGLLAACPGVRVVATSRAPLRVRGEYLAEVTPLALPPESPDGAPMLLDTLAATPAVALFVARVQAIQPTFALTPANATTIAAICRRLDGLPLALELVAPRARLLPPQALLDRLDTRLVLLTEGARDLPERQRTLRATFDWSHDLLDLGARTVLRRLAVFVDGWSLEAAGVVCSGLEGADPGEGVERGEGVVLSALDGSDGSDGLDLLNGLATLVDQSLVYRREAGGPDSDSDSARFAMLETVRDYAWEQLVAQGEAAATERARARYYVAFTKAAWDGIRGPEQERWIARLEGERNNVRATLRWTLDRRETLIGLKLAVAMWSYWDTRGHWSEGRTWLDSLLALPDPLEDAPDSTSIMPMIELRAQALNCAGLSALRQGDDTRATGCFEEGLALRRRLGDPFAASGTLNNLGLVAKRRGEYERAEAYLAESLALLRAEGNPFGVSIALTNLGNVVRLRGERTRALALLEEGLSVARTLGNPERQADLLLILGRVHLEQRDYAAADAAAGECLQLSRAIGAKHQIAGALQILGETAYAQGDGARATGLCEESLTQFEELGERKDSVEPLAVLGEIARRAGTYERAVALHTRCLAVLREAGDRKGQAGALMRLAHVARDQGGAARAAQLYRESLAALAADAPVLDATDATDTVAPCLEGFAPLLCAHDEPLRATQLAAAAQTLREATQAPRPPVEEADHDALLVQLAAALRDAAFATAWAVGQRLSREQAIAAALTVPLEATLEAKLALRHARE